MQSIKMTSIVRINERSASTSFLLNPSRMRSLTLSKSTSTSFILNPMESLTLSKPCILTGSLELIKSTVMNIPRSPRCSLSLHKPSNDWECRRIDPVVWTCRLVCMVSDVANADCPSVGSSAQPAELVFAHPT